MGNKIALVTGGSRGLGKDMALAIARKGIDVIITYNENAAAAREVTEEIRKHNVKAGNSRRR
jgi:NAD(P)-dependent dehydrogenase (short-subunit alcohol dehydrogenase family)